MTFEHWLVVVSAFVSIFGSIAYVRDTLLGKSKPNRVTWSMWAFAPLVGTGAALSIGADIWATSRVFLAGFIPLIVFIASFINSKSYWKLTTFDLLCGVCSIVAILVWIGIDSPRLAVLIAAIGDGFAALPTIRKAWLYPETETGITYAAGLLAVLLVLPSIPEWNIENSAFQIYILTANTILVFSIYRRRVFAWL